MYLFREMNRIAKASYGIYLVIWSTTRPLSEHIIHG